MAIQVKVPKEISEYSEKLIGGLSIRQLATSAISIGIAIPLYIFGKDYISTSLLGKVIMIIIAPIMGIGFIKIEGMTFERYLALFFKHMFGINRKKLCNALSIEMNTEVKKKKRKSILEKIKDDQPKSEYTYYIAPIPEREAQKKALKCCKKSRLDRRKKH